MSLQRRNQQFFGLRVLPLILSGLEEGPLVMCATHGEYCLAFCGAIPTPNYALHCDITKRHIFFSRRCIPKSETMTRISSIKPNIMRIFMKLKIQRTVGIPKIPVAKEVKGL